MISFGLGLVFFIIGTAAVAVCLIAIPGPSRGAGESHAAPSHGHGSH